MDVAEIVHLIPGSLIVPGNVELNQFNLINKTFHKGFDNIMMADLTFKRKVMYHLTNTYLPTISLLVLVELTLFLDESKLDIAVTLSLTVLLVIYTFYQSIAASIPKTAYIKFIDIWLIFVLIMPFTIFVVETIMFLDRTKRNLKSAYSQSPTRWVEHDTNAKPLKFHRVAKIGITVLSSGLTILYFIFAVYIYGNA